MKTLVAHVFLSLVIGIVAFDTCSKERCEDSCKNRCGDKPNDRYTCQCNEHCEKYKDCCKDHTICKYIDPDFDEAAHYEKSDSSCAGRCNAKYNKKDTCHCNKKCGKFKNCCSDYKELCGGGTGSGSTAKDCDQETKDDSGSFKDIDPDFKEATHTKKSDSSCAGRCNAKYNKKDTCHCNKKCGKFKNCCSDYKELCGGSTGGGSTAQDYNEETNDDSGSYRDFTITIEEIKAVSEKLYQSDDNKAADSDIILNKQELVQKDTTRNDLCDKPLYKYVNEELFKRPTYAAFIKLHDNYDRKTGTDETHSPEEVKEQEHFLQETMKTKIMKELYTFFQKKGLYSTEKEFVDDLQKMWFGLYSRSKGEQDSSGFEHVFVGEVKKGKVSGFHSWIRFYHLEKKGMLNYYSHNFDGPWNSYPDVLGKQFDWDGFLKEVGSQFIGSSPEFDLAMYTLCFISRPGKKCRISMDGHEMSIQTYEWTKNTYGKGKRYIATAYPEV